MLKEGKFIREFIKKETPLGKEGGGPSDVIDLL